MTEKDARILDLFRQLNADQQNVFISILDQYLQEDGKES